jgi:hypothetical protein
VQLQLNATSIHYFTHQRKTGNYNVLPVTALPNQVVGTVIIVIDTVQVDHAEHDVRIRNLAVRKGRGEKVDDFRHGWNIIRFFFLLLVLSQIHSHSDPNSSTQPPLCTLLQLSKS